MNETASAPVAERRASADLLKRRFAHQAAELASAASRARSGHDPLALHDLELSARDLEMMLRTWGGLLAPRPRRAALRSLRRLRRRLGGARGLESRITLLEAVAAAPGEPVLTLLEELRRKLRKRTARAANRIRPRRLRPLMARIEAASASLSARRAADARGLDRARAYLLARRAMARIAGGVRQVPRFGGCTAGAAPRARARRHAGEPDAR